MSLCRGTVHCTPGKFFVVMLQATEVALVENGESKILDCTIEQTFSTEHKWITGYNDNNGGWPSARLFG